MFIDLLTLLIGHLLAMDTQSALSWPKPIEHVNNLEQL